MLVFMPIPCSYPHKVRMISTISSFHIWAFPTTLHTPPHTVLQHAVRQHRIPQLPRLRRLCAEHGRHRRGVAAHRARSAFGSSCARPLSARRRPLRNGALRGARPHRRLHGHGTRTGVGGSETPHREAQ